MDNHDDNVKVFIGDMRDMSSFVYRFANVSSCNSVALS